LLEDWQTNRDHNGQDAKQGHHDKEFEETDAGGLLER
jgi:hypothetical protein